MGGELTGHPTPLTHPSMKQNPLRKAKGGHQPTGHQPAAHPIYDPQHPINRARGWTPNPPLIMPAQQQMTGWIPPAPQMQGTICHQQQPQHHGYNPIVPENGKGQWCYPWGQRMPATPQLQRSFDHGGMARHERIPTGMDTGYEPSDESAESPHVRRRGTHRMISRTMQYGRPKKRHVMLTFGGKEVKASYWEP